MYDFLYSLNVSVSYINACLSDYVLVFLLCGAGVFYTLKTKFVQVRCFKEGICSVFGGLFKKQKTNNGSISSFQALATAVAAQIGTGNIVGACSAILLGGPGAVFWMWIISFFGMATSYAEGVLAVWSAKKSGGTKQITAGPVAYISEAFSGKTGKLLCMFFAFFAIIALGFTGSMVQSNAVSESLYHAFGVPFGITGIVLTLCVGAVVSGGAKSVARTAEKIVPLMALFFMAGSIAILVMYRERLPAVLLLIFKSAFAPCSVLGAASGITLRNAIFYGAKRGLFSNEAGMGTSPHAHAMVTDKTPHEQGVVAMMGVFIDTIVLMSLTALSVIVVLCDENITALGISSTNMAQLAFSKAFGKGLGEMFVALCMFFFAFTSILGWSFFGRINVHYLFGEKADKAYTVMVLFFVFLGTVSSNELVWNLTDFFNQLMVIPNALALLVLSGVVKNCYEDGKKHK